MPVKNGEKFLREAVGSILNQTYKNLEFIIVNDCSNDKTLALLKRFKDKRVNIINNKSPLGLTKSLNKALLQVKGEIIARMDADDIARCDRLEKQLFFLKTHKKVGVVGSAVRIINEQGKVVAKKLYPINHQKIMQEIFITNPLRHPTVMFYKSLINKYGNYDPSLDGAEDYDLWLRYANYTQLSNLNDTLVDCRTHKRRVSVINEKKVLRSAFYVRMKAIKEYGYSQKNYYYVVSSLISYIMPSKLKKLLMGPHNL